MSSRPCRRILLDTVATALRSSRCGTRAIAQADWMSIQRLPIRRQGRAGVHPAGVLLALDGLPTLDGRAGLLPGGKPKVTDGPFAEAKEVLGGYWVQVSPRRRQWNGPPAAPPRRTR